MTAPDLFSDEIPDAGPWHETEIAGTRYRARIETRNGRLHVHVEARLVVTGWTEVRWRGARLEVIQEVGIGKLEEGDWRGRRVQLTDGRYEGDFV